MVEALYALTPRHQRNQNLPSGIQEYVKYIHCKEYLWRLAAFFKRANIIQRHYGAPLHRS